MLLLFDIDGTLLTGSSGPHFDAMRAALSRVFGSVFEQGDDQANLGRTDMEIARAAAAAQGVSDAAFDEHREALTAAWLEALDADLFRQAALPGVEDMLSRLGEDGHVSTLVTGNLRPLAEVKLQAAGLADLLDLEIGGYGSDAEQRSELPGTARRRAGSPGPPWPRATTVLIGDTPRDVLAAKADQLRCVAVTTGGFSPEDLRDADQVATDAEQVRAAIARLERTA